MKYLLYAAAWMTFANVLPAENKAVLSPITMEQLMRELRIQGGNFVFDFDEPVYARVTVVTMQDMAKEKETVYFDTASANRKIELYFTASQMFVGDYPRGDLAANPRKMLVKLSDCKETDGTRILYYDEIFLGKSGQSGEVGMYRPEVPDVPELDRDYILHWYFKRGESYEAKATIRFSAKPFEK